MIGLNLLLVFIPISWALHYVWHDPSQTQDTIMFVLICLAIIPLAKLLGFATEQLALRVGETIGSQLPVTSRNAMDFIVAIIALVKGDLLIVQSSLVGSMLNNLLLVSGMCFVAGFSEQGLLSSAAPLLTLSIFAVLLPAVVHLAVKPSADVKRDEPNACPTSNSREATSVLKMSRGVSVILLFIYALVLVFQLCSHRFGDNSAADLESQSDPVNKDSLKQRFRWNVKSGTVQSAAVTPAPANTAQGAPHSAEKTDDMAVTRTSTATSVTPAADLESGAKMDEEEETPVINLGSAIIVVICVIVLMVFTVDFHSIPAVTDTTGISVEWVGLILLPIVGSVAEYLSVVTVSAKDKLVLTVDVAVGSSIQTALFWIPLLVVIAWMMDKPLSLLFDPFESIALFLAVISINYTISDGRSNWLEGIILMCLYVIVATVFFFYKPNTALQAALRLTCGNS